MASQIIRRVDDGRDYSSPDTLLEVDDFQDTRVFAVPYDSPHTAVVYQPESLSRCQSSRGPTFLVVGSGVSDERLERNIGQVAQQYGATLAQLKAARSGACVFVR